MGQDLDQDLEELGKIGRFSPWDSAWCLGGEVGVGMKGGLKSPAAFPLIEIKVLLECGTGEKNKTGQDTNFKTSEQGVNGANPSGKPAKP